MRRGRRLVMNGQILWPGRDSPDARCLSDGLYAVEVLINAIAAKREWVMMVAERLGGDAGAAVALDWRNDPIAQSFEKLELKWSVLSTRVDNLNTCAGFPWDHDCHFPFARLGSGFRDAASSLRDTLQLVERQFVAIELPLRRLERAARAVDRGAAYPDADMIVRKLPSGRPRRLGGPSPAS